jgi:hypothetical protein
MKPFSSFIVVLAFLLTAVPSEARSRSRRKAASSGTPAYYGGGLSRDRGISAVEADAAGAVLHEVAHAPKPPAPDPNAAPKRHRSADYYRVYSKQRQVVVVKPGSKPGRAIFRPKPTADR